MPYITKERREALLVKEEFPANPGELNFMISLIIDQYITKHGLSYTKMNEIAGVLACVQQEVYRKITAPYEEKKIIENGDVWNPAHLGK